MTTSGSGSGVLQRIQEVLREHREEINEQDLCICGEHCWHPHASADWPTHVAALIQAALDVPEPEPKPKQQLFEVVSGYDTRIIRRNLTRNQADVLCRDLNRRTEHGARVVEQR